MLKQMNLALEPKIEELFKRVELELKNLLGEKLKKLILFGSYSRGDYDRESDIDLIGLVDEPHPDEEYEEEKSFKPLLRNIEKEGIELYAA